MREIIAGIDRAQRVLFGTSVTRVERTLKQIGSGKSRIVLKDILRKKMAFSLVPALRKISISREGNNIFLK